MNRSIDPLLKVSLKVSVIVMTFNRPESLGRCLESLSKQTFPSVMFEVVIVDGSVVPARELVTTTRDRLDIQHVIGPNLGIAGNRNRGASHARGACLAFMDDDCVARPDWLKRLYGAFQTTPHAMIGGGVENVSPENAYAAAGQVITEAVMAYFNPPEQEPTFFPGLNFAISRQAFLELGGCDSRFQLLGGGEDRDFIDRWRHAGGSLVSCTEAIVRHEHRSSLRGFVRQYFHYGRGGWLYQRLKRESVRANLPEQFKPTRSMSECLQSPLRQLAGGMRWKVRGLIWLWWFSYRCGIIWQAMIELVKSAKPNRKAEDKKNEEFPAVSDDLDHHKETS